MFPIKIRSLENQIKIYIWYLNLLMVVVLSLIAVQDSWKTTLLLRVKEKLKAKELEEDDLT